MSFVKSLISFFCSIFSKNDKQEVINVTKPIENQTDSIQTKPIDDSEYSTDIDDGYEQKTEEINENNINEEIVIEDDIIIDVEENNEIVSVEPTEEIVIKNPKYNKVCIFLDHGHCKDTPGKKSPDKTLYEWKYNREIVKMIESELDKLGIEHWNTHPEDNWVDASHNTDSKDLVLRCQRINKKYSEMKSIGKTAFMISVHVNAAGSGQWYNATGWSAWTTKGQNNSDKLSDCLYDAAEEILKPLNMKIRTDKSDGDRDWESNFYILKNSNCVCVLTENFFMDCESDVKWLLSDEGKKTVTKIHIEGIKKYIERYC